MGARGTDPAQHFTTNQIVDRVVKGYPKKGPIWHFQGRGKSLLMVFASQKLRMHPKLGNPTVMIVVDRIDLDTQITATFNATDVPNMVGVATRQELQTLLGQDVRKVLITTIHKFGTTDCMDDPDKEGSAQGVSISVKSVKSVVKTFGSAWNERSNIIVERIVTDIDDIVKKVRFPDWQHTSQGERLVQKELRRTLLKYKLHTDQELFDKAYDYIRQYY